MFPIDLGGGVTQTESKADLTFIFNYSFVRGVATMTASTTCSKKREAKMQGKKGKS